VAKSWQLTRDTPIVKFLDQLSKVSTQLIQLHSLQQTHLAMRQIQLMKKRAQDEHGNANGLDQS